ncbi:MAG TPA: ABC transporter permease [Myxococcota bacterium]|nr:ABC transporter permease [Myxococcota bacterium]
MTNGVLDALRRDRLARFGLHAIAGLVAIAVAAPLLALDQPLVLRTRGGVSFPFFPALVNRLLFENAVDLLFNLALLAAPAYGLGVAIARRRGVSWRRVAVGLAALQVLLFVACLPERFGPIANPLHLEEPIPDTKAEIAASEARGEPVWAVFPLRPFSYRETDPAHSVEPPDRTHWLGTDKEGRDVFARMVFGTRISLTVGVVAVSLYVAIGVVLGALAGWFGGRIDLLISRVIEVMICLPTFFLILALVALVEQRSVFHVMAIIGVTSWTGVARLVRAEFLRQRALDYVQAAVALGIPTWRILFLHMLPNAMGPVLVSATFGVASAILVESSLAFLGLGDVSVASWGATLNAGRLEQKAWLVLVPGFAIFFVVSVFNLVGEGLRDALDPRLRS